MRIQPLVLSIVTLTLSVSVAFGQNGTEFTYQGRLLDAGQPANGLFNVDFGLWDDPAAGNQVDVTNTFNSLPILEGLFTVELDFGASAFDNNDRWIEISIDGVPMLPRQPITRTPYAIQTRGIVVDDVGNIGIGTSTPNYPLQIDSSGLTGIYAQNTATSGLTYGGQFFNDSTFGRGVFGQATATVGTTYGGRFESDSTDGRGVYGFASATSGNTHGGRFQNLSTSGIGVSGQALATSGTTYGGFFQSDSTVGRGVYGFASATSGLTFGGAFQSSSTDGVGVSGQAFATSGTTYGGRFQSSSTDGVGVSGQAFATSGTTYGGRFESDSTSGFAGYFDGKGNDAVYIENTSDGRGLQAVAPADTAVWGRTTTGFAGVHGVNAAVSGRGVYGQASDTSGTNYGVYGASSSATGFDFYAGGAGTNYGASSSRRWKGNVVPIGDPLDKLSKLQGVYFDWDQEHGGAHDVGMIAEEVGAVLPEIVQYEQNGVDAIGMDYSKMTPLLVEAVNALRAENSNLREAVNALHAENSDLRAENEKLQQRFARLESIVSQLQAQNN